MNRQRETPITGIPGYTGHVPRRKFLEGKSEGKSFALYRNQRKLNDFGNGFSQRPGSVPQHRGSLKYVHREIPINVTHVDPSRHYEIFNLYEKAQFHRDNYRDLTGTEPISTYFAPSSSTAHVSMPYPAKSYYLHRNRRAEPDSEDDNWAFGRRLSRASYGGCRDFLGRLRSCRSPRAIVNFDESHLQPTLFGYC